MKKYLMWSFERGSRPYDVICLVILAFIFLTPSWVFTDRPDFMRIDRNEPVRRTTDDNGSVVYTVQINTPVFTPAAEAEKSAVERLREVVHEKFEVSRTVPVYDSVGAVIAYSIWIDSETKP
jgi:hypothetical protein